MRSGTGLDAAAAGHGIGRDSGREEEVAYLRSFANFAEYHILAL